jgi:hypothetical protein
MPPTVMTALVGNVVPVSFLFASASRTAFSIFSLGSDPDLPEESAYAGAEGVAVHSCSFGRVFAENFSAFPERNFNFATRAIGRECQVNGTAELMRDEIADETAAITRPDWDLDRRAAKLAPRDRQDRRCIGASAMPAHRHAAIRAR